MRFTPVSVALLALAAPSFAPGVHGAPVAASGHGGSLAVRQDIISGLLGSLSQVIKSLLGSQSQLPDQIVQKAVQELESALAAATGLVPRALSSSSGATSRALSASLTTRSFSATTRSVGLATDTFRNTSSVSLGTPRPPSTPATRMRRQSPTPLPVSLPSALPGIVPSGSLSALEPLQSLISAASSKLAASGSAPSKSIGGKPSPSIGRV